MIEVPDVQRWFPPIEVPELPESGFQQQWNAIVDMWVDPCEAPMHVYIELLKPLLGAAVVMMFAPEFDEIVEEFVEPGKYGGCYRNRRKQRGAKRKTVKPPTGKPFRIGIPSLDDLIAGMIPGRDLLGRRVPGAREAYMWQVFNAVEARLFGLMMADVVGSVFYAWHSALLQTEFCRDTALQVAKCWDADWVYGPEGYMVIVIQNGPKDARNGGSAGLDGIYMTRQSWRGLASWELENIGSGVATGTFFVLDAENEPLRSVPFEIPPGGTSGGTQTMQIQGQGALRMGLYVEAGAVRVFNTMLWGTQSPG